MPADTPARGMTPRETARYLRVGIDRVRGWISCGELTALDVSDRRTGPRRYVVLPEHLEAFARRRAAVTTPAPTPRRKRRTAAVDYYPD